MDWQNERYVRVYTRDTPDWLLWSWEARALLLLLLRKVDRAGVLELGRHGVKAIAVTVGMPLDVVERTIPELTKEGTVEIQDGRLVIPNYLEAQEATQSDAQRQRESRARRRDLARADVTECDDEVTKSDETVTSGHEESQPVTPSLAVPSLAERGDDPPAEPALSLVGESEEHKTGRARALAYAAISELNARTGRRFDAMGKQALRNARRLVADGYTADDARLVVQAKCEQWLRDERMHTHLRPSTVLRPSNFRRYREEDVGTGAPARSAGGYQPPADLLADGYRGKGAT